MFPIQDSVPSRSVPVVTRALILINVLVFFFELMLPRHGLEQIVYLFGIVPARFTHPDWAAYVGFPVDGYWTVLTHQFLHGGWLHLIANMWTLWIFGDNVEDQMGSLRFATFYLICGSIAGLTQVLTNPDSTIPSVGASGAIAGVLGAYFIFYPRGRILTILPIFVFIQFIEVPAVIYLLFWFAIQLYAGLEQNVREAAMGGVAWWAHIGGFMFGLALAPMLAINRPPRRRSR